MKKYFKKKKILYFKNTKIQEKIDYSLLFETIHALRIVRMELTIWHNATFLL